MGGSPNDIGKVNCEPGQQYLFINLHSKANWPVDSKHVDPINKAFREFNSEVDNLSRFINGVNSFHNSDLGFEFTEIQPRYKLIQQASGTLADFQ